MKKLLIIGGGIIVLIAMAMLGGGEREDGVEVTVQAAEPGRIAASVMASGTLNYREVINLRTEVTGRIESIHVEEGDVVKKGDTLMTISAELFQADVDQQRAFVNMRRIAIDRQAVFLAQQERIMKRQKDLFEDGHINKDAFERTERDYDLAKLDLDARKTELIQAEASLASSEDRLRKTVIRAPIDGIITQENAKIGETVVAGTTNIIGSALMDISDPSAVLAEVQVAETDILGLKIGQQAEVITVADPDNPMAGEVIMIGTTARTNPSNQQNDFLVKILLDSTAGDFSRLAISARAEIYTQVGENALTAPVEAVMSEKENGKTIHFIFIKDGDKAVKRIVEQGIQTDTLVEIKSGLAAGEELITGPYRTLRSMKDGRSVRLKSADDDKDATADSEESSD